MTTKIKFLVKNKNFCEIIAVFPHLKYCFMVSVNFNSANILLCPAYNLNPFELFFKLTESSKSRFLILCQPSSALKNTPFLRNVQYSVFLGIQSKSSFMFQQETEIKGRLVGSSHQTLWSRGDKTNHLKTFNVTLNIWSHAVHTNTDTHMSLQQAWADMRDSGYNNFAAR